MELTVQTKCLRRRLGTFLVYVVFFTVPVYQYTTTVVVSSRHVMFANDREITMMGTICRTIHKLSLLYFYERRLNKVLIQHTHYNFEIF